jgi:hypothetical protein
MAGVTCAEDVQDQFVSSDEVAEGAGDACQVGPAGVTAAGPGAGEADRRAGVSATDVDATPRAATVIGAMFHWMGTPRGRA